MVLRNFNFGFHILKCVKYLQQLQILDIHQHRSEVPFEVPLTKIDVPGKGCFVLSLTTPETLISCAVSPTEKI
jgi:hypothetical protein